MVAQSQRQWEEGEMVHDDASGKVYLVLDGSLRHVPNPDTFYGLFCVPLDANHMVRCNDPQPIGAALSHGAALNKAHGDPHIYLVNEGRKRHITSPDVFNKYQFSWDRVRSTSSAAVNAIPDGPAIGPAIC